MIRLIVGLGNPGRQYEKNRHNAGFLFLDRLLALSGSGVWANESKFHGLVANIFFQQKNVILLKPQTFMNRSGLSVAAVSRFYKIKAEEILVVHDELDLEVGVARLKKNGGHAGHNGLRDIMAQIGDKGFYRIRVGVGRPPLGKQVADHVLSNPSKKEGELMFVAFDRVEAMINDIVSGDMALVMNEMNK